MLKILLLIIILTEIKIKRFKHNWFERSKVKMNEYTSVVCNEKLLFN